MLVVVGGHSRGVGKTTVVTGLIRAFPEARWTAVKITPRADGTARGRPYVLCEETTPGASDTGRYLEAGAARSFWLSAASGRLEAAVAAVRPILECSTNAIVESDSILDFIRPELYLVVVDYSVRDWKDSTRAHLGCADALVLVNRGAGRPQCGDPPARLLEGKPAFVVRPPGYVSEELAALVAGRFGWPRVRPAERAIGKAISNDSRLSGPE